MNMKNDSKMQDDLFYSMLTNSRKIYRDKRIRISKREITFSVTENCNLNCSYCYLPGKNTLNQMSFEVARKAIDYFLSNPRIFTEPGVMLDFIGGEPLLTIDRN